MVPQKVTMKGVRKHRTGLQKYTNKMDMNANITKIYLKFLGHIIRKDGVENVTKERWFH